MDIMNILKNKKFLLIAGAVILVIIAGFLIFNYKGSGSANLGPDGIILFYGDGCLHCKIVDDFISQNKVEDKVEITRLEVFNNVDNQKILLQRVQACKLNVTDVGVPFLWDGKNCIIGDQDIIKFFKDKAGIQ